jgi:hypothetical protein
MPVLEVRLLADKSSGTRVTMFDPVTGEKKLVNPETPGNDHEAWPLAGMELKEAVEHPVVPMSWVRRGVREGWIEVEGEVIVHAPGGPENDPWATTHTFYQADQIVLKTTTGKVLYDVLRSPGKDSHTGEVFWAYELELVEDNRG